LRRVGVHSVLPGRGFGTQTGACLQDAEDSGKSPGKRIRNPASTAGRTHDHICVRADLSRPKDASEKVRRDKRIGQSTAADKARASYVLPFAFLVLSAMQ
jgi:hypothetical protein